MIDKANEALEKAKQVRDIINHMIGSSHDLDLQRLLKQIDADLMDVQHKLAIVVRLSKKD
jgi:hypothetical protein